MDTIPASRAKTHFGALLDQAQHESITIEKKGRPIAVIMSFRDYQEQINETPSPEERARAIKFLQSWRDRKPLTINREKLANDPRAQALLEKYEQAK